MRSVHPFEAYVPINADKLIIGTIPPPRFCVKEPCLRENDVNFYYGSQDNDFWKIIAKVFALDFIYTNTSEAIKQRHNLLDTLKIGITDIVESCIHKDNSAKDENLIDIKHKDLKSLLKQYPSIRTLIYTSGFVKKEMNACFNTYHTIDKNYPKKQSLKIDDKFYEVRILYSPSGMALINMGENGIEKRLNQYREFLMSP